MMIAAATEVIKPREPVRSSGSRILVHCSRAIAGSVVAGPMMMSTQPSPAAGAAALVIALIRGACR